MTPSTTRLLGESYLDVVLAERITLDAAAPNAALPRKRRRSIDVDMFAPPCEKLSTHYPLCPRTNQPYLRRAIEHRDSFHKAYL